MFRRKKSGNTALLSEKPMIEGYLMKRAVQSGRNWRKRYFALYGTKLVYWTKRGDKKEKGEMLITEDFFVSDATTKGFGFMISDFTTTYYLGADSAAVKEFWTHTIRRVIRKQQQDTDYFGTKGGVGIKVAAAALPITVAQAQNDLNKRMEAYESSKKLGGIDSADSSSTLLYVKPTNITASSTTITTIVETKTKQTPKQETKKAQDEGPVSPHSENRRKSSHRSTRKSGRQTSTSPKGASTTPAKPTTKPTAPPAPPTLTKDVSFVGYVETNFGSQVDLDSSDDEENNNNSRKKSVSPPVSPTATEDKAMEKEKRASITKRHSSKRRSSSRTSSPKHGTQTPKSGSRSPSTKSIASTPSARSSHAQTPQLTTSARPSLAATKPVAEKPTTRPSMPTKTPAPAPAAASPAKKVGVPAKPKSAMNSRVAMWQNRADGHNEKQATNVFSGGFTGNKALKRGDPGYGKAIAGSKTEQRAIAATQWVDKQIAQLVDVIRTTGKPSAEHGNKIATTFGPLFLAFQDISDSLVGILMRAKRRKELWYDGDMLFQGRDDGVVIYIM